jgi:hypothetical protein
MRIRRGLSSQVLPCGCLVGVYETYGDDVVRIVDVRVETCLDATHVHGNLLPAAAPLTAAVPDDDQAQELRNTSSDRSSSGDRPD